MAVPQRSELVAGRIGRAVRHPDEDIEEDDEYPRSTSGADDTAYIALAQYLLDQTGTAAWQMTHMPEPKVSTYAAQLPPSGASEPFAGTVELSVSDATVKKLTELQKYRAVKKDLDMIKGKGHGT